MPGILPNALLPLTTFNIGYSIYLYVLFSLLELESCLSYLLTFAILQYFAQFR